MIASIFEGNAIKLAAIDPERDAETISAWTHDPEYWHLLDDGPVRQPVRPVSPGQVRKKLEKESGGGQSAFSFAIRTISDDRLIATVRFFWIDWPNSSAWISLGIGSAQDRGSSLAGDVLDLLLQYGFTELNFFRISMHGLEYNLTGQMMMERAGFVREVTLRKSICQAGKYWDGYVYGLFAADWRQRREAKEAAQ